MEKLLTVKEVAEALGMSVFYVTNHTARAGRPAEREPALHAILLGGNRALRYREADVADFLSRCDSKGSEK
jgi:hypothetical protein